MNEKTLRKLERLLSRINHLLGFGVLVVVTLLLHAELFSVLREFPALVRVEEAKVEGFSFRKGEILEVKDVSERNLRVRVGRYEYEISGRWEYAKERLRKRIYYIFEEVLSGNYLKGERVG